MKILIVAATTFELQPLLDFIEQNKEQLQHEYEIGITGIGMMHTAFAMEKFLQQTDADMAIQVGVAGAFNTNLALGDIVRVQSEILGDLGVENRDEYLDIFETGLVVANEFPYQDGALENDFSEQIFGINLPQAKGLTVNTVSGSEATIAKRRAIYNADIETMEGAAFHYACIVHGIPFVQIRSISNYVEPRDKSKWKMKEAIVLLNEYLIKLVGQ